MTKCYAVFSAVETTLNFSVMPIKLIQNIKLRSCHIIGSSSLYLNCDIKSHDGSPLAGRSPEGNPITRVLKVIGELLLLENCVN